MADLKSVAQALTFMGKVDTFTTSTNTHYVAAKYKDIEWIISQRGDRYMFTKAGKYIIVCEKDATPIIDSLKLVKEGKLDLPKNKAAISLQTHTDEMNALQEDIHKFAAAVIAAKSN